MLAVSGQAISQGAVLTPPAATMVHVASFKMAPVGTVNTSRRVHRICVAHNVDNSCAECLVEQHVLARILERRACHKMLAHAVDVLEHRYVLHTIQISAYSNLEPEASAADVPSRLYGYVACG
jgi:hypothetical protein